MARIGVRAVIAHRLRTILTCAFLWLPVSGCQDSQPDRTASNAAVKGQSIASDITIAVQGGSVVSSTGDSEFPGVPTVVIRAQSLDLRIDIKSKACRPNAVHLVATHLPENALATTTRTFFDTVNPLLEAARLATGAGLSFDDDPHDPNWTPLDQAGPFGTDIADDRPVRLQWTTCLDRSTRHVKILPGHVDLGACGFPASEAPNGTCAEAADGLGQELAEAHFVVRHRLRAEVAERFQFAMWGNNASNRAVRAQLISDVNQSEAIFTIIGGDLTETGTKGQLLIAQRQLDSRLTIPWYATLGDRDVQDSAVHSYPQIIGASTFAFDAGLIRLLVLDSADRAIGLDTRELMSSWLGTTELGWNEPRPPTQLSVSHVPPFDVHGSRGFGLKQRAEGATIVAGASRAKVPYLLTSQLSEYVVQSTADTLVVHCGGAGAALTGPDPTAHYWVLVTVDGACGPGTEPFPCAYGTDETPCPCIGIEKRSLVESTD